MINNTDPGVNCLLFYLQKAKKWRVHSKYKFGWSLGVIWWCHDYYILQGVEGVCFYVVGSGEFEVLATKVRIFFP